MRKRKRISAIVSASSIPAEEYRCYSSPYLPSQRKKRERVTGPLRARWKGIARRFPSNREKEGREKKTTERMKERDSRRKWMTGGGEEKYKPVPAIYPYALLERKKKRKMTSQVPSSQGEGKEAEISRSRKHIFVREGKEKKGGKPECRCRRAEKVVKEKGGRSRKASRSRIKRISAAEEKGGRKAGETTTGWCGRGRKRMERSPARDRYDALTLSRKGGGGKENHSNSPVKGGTVITRTPQ